MELEQREFRADPLKMKRLRVAAGLTVKDFTTLADLDRTTVAKILRGDPVFLKSLAVAAKRVFNITNPLEVLHPDELQAMGVQTDVPSPGQVLEWEIEEYLTGWEKTVQWFADTTRTKSPPGFAASVIWRRGPARRRGNAPRGLQGCAKLHRSSCRSEVCLVRERDGPIWSGQARAGRSRRVAESACTLGDVRANAADVLRHAEVPDPVKDLVSRCVAITRSQRPADMKAVLKVLKEWV